MIQIVGFLGCFYLVVKALEIFASNSFRNENGKLKESAIYAALTALGGACMFAVWLSEQGSSFPSAPTADVSSEQLTESIQQNCVKLAKTTEEAVACMK